MWSRVFRQLCNLALASSQALQDACELAPVVIEEVVKIPSIDTLPLSLLVDFVEALVNSYRLGQLRNDNCMHAINGLTRVSMNTLSTEVDRLPMNLIDHVFEIFVLQASLAIDVYSLGHSASDMVRWFHIHGQESLLSRGVSAMCRPLWHLPWGVFKRGIQAWAWYLAHTQKIRPVTINRVSTDFATIHRRPSPQGSCNVIFDRGESKNRKTYSIGHVVTLEILPVII